MGIEYVLKVPDAYRARVAEETRTGIANIWQRLDPDAGNHVGIDVLPEGLLICDYLSDRVIAALALRAAIDWLLLFSPRVLVEDA